MDGTAFGRYRLMDLLGRGSMGEVWRAYDTATSRTVAVKVLPEHLAHDHAFEQRFRREARLAAGLNDPHVVPIHNFGEIDGRLYVDMRVIEGHDLTTLLADGPLPPDRAVKIVEQVASALNTAHRVGLVHRDVKPSNILVTDRDFAYLIDFGIARTADETALTNTGATVGTFAYMAPERFSSGDIDTRSDVYALACVLFEALTGHPPFPGDSLAQQLNGHVLTPPPQPSRRNPTVPRTLDRVIATGMAKVPAQRYSTTTELADAAQQAIDESTHQRRAAAPLHYSTPPTMPAPLRHATPPTTPAPLRHSTPPPTPAPRLARPPESPDRPARSPWWKRKAIVIPALLTCVVLVVAATFLLLGIRNNESGPGQARVSTTSPRATGSPIGPSEPYGDINRMLLSPREIDSIVGTTGLRGPIESGLSTDADIAVSPPECDSIVDAVSPADLKASGYTTMRAQSLEGDTSALAIQAVFEYGSPDAARRLASTLIPAWQTCNGKAASSGRYQYKVRDVVADQTRLSAVYDVPEISISCANVLEAAFVYIIRTAVCREGVTNEAQTIADRIAGNI